MQVSRVDGDLQRIDCVGVKGGGCTHENGVASENGGRTIALVIVAS